MQGPDDRDLGDGSGDVSPVRLVRKAESRHPSLHRFGAEFDGVDLEVVESLIRRLAD